MTQDKFYQALVIKLNENATTDKISIDKARACVLGNNTQNRLIEIFLERRFEDDIRYLQKILVPNKVISSSKVSKEYTEFPLPKDYFDFSNLFVLASKGECKNKRMTCEEIKDDDKHHLLIDANYKPSFKHRETLFNMASDKIILYTADDFTTDSATLSYYRYPVQMGLVNDSDPESNFNSNVLEFDDKFMNRVIDLCAAEFLLNTDDQKFQAEKQNAITKN
jgi:hypothetical protein